MIIMIMTRTRRIGEEDEKMKSLMMRIGRTTEKRRKKCGEVVTFHPFMASTSVLHDNHVKTDNF
jgi:hypothetical protein